MGENLLKFEPSGSSRSDFVPSRHRAASLFTEIANVGNQPLYFVMLFGLRGSCSHHTPSRGSESCDTRYARTASRHPRSGTSEDLRSSPAAAEEWMFLLGTSQNFGTEVGGCVSDGINFYLNLQRLCELLQATVDEM